MSVPPSVSLGQKLIYALVGLMAVRTLLTVVFKDDLIDSYAEANNSSLPRQVAEDGAPAYLMIAIVSLLLFGGLLAVSAYYFSSGAGWSRIVATVMAVLTVLGGLLAFGQPAPAWYVAVNVVAALVAAVVVLVMYRQDANEWFAKRV